MSRAFPRCPRRGAVAAIGVACAVTAPAVAAEVAASDSVVRIECALEGGTAKATGFVWPEPGYVVTALHAVAGCSEIVVFSEPKERETLGAILRVDLDADLALLALDDPLDIPAVGFAETPPDVRADYLAWGYPLAAEEMIEIEIDFGGGRKAGVTTLGKAFASDELDQLFRDQSYPTRETQILRVTSTIQPGHSGAPIFDHDGNVVAIADGGLLGGWRTINWSIPAYVYLPGLLVSEDPEPTAPSPQAILHSSVTPVAAPVEVGPSEPIVSADGAEAIGALSLVRRQLNFAEVAEMVSASGDATAAEHFGWFADAFLPDDLAFDIYEDATSGATLAVPSGLPLLWDDDIQGVITGNESGKVAYAARLGVAGSFAEATDVQISDFVAVLSEGTEWDYDNATIYGDEIDEELETATFDGDISGVDQNTGQDIHMAVMLHISGPVYIGAAVAKLEPPDAFGEDDIRLYDAFTFGASYLTDFALN